MFDQNFVLFYLCLVAVPQIAWSARVNTTASDGKVIISGNHNEVVVSTDRDNRISLAKIKSSLESVNKTNTELFSQVQAISQRLSALESQATNDYALQFTSKGTSDYVIKRGTPSLKAVTVCLWMKSSDKGTKGTLLSYAASGSDNQLLLYNYKKFQLWTGQKYRNTAVSANDGQWHHICLTWENSAGSWKMYKDGKVAASGKGINTGHVIRGGGVLILGQEQDSLGGTFDANQCFIGELTGVNIWNHVINEQEINHMTKSCLRGVGNVFQWSDFKSHVKGSVRSIKRSC
ncbi:neuronal pentraxin-2-like [Porites lutea]|uniref:neuronal pentraxin-2-like n=1 Tax=Porites lutea TaxID=51062 RepID=UPI003CC69BD4